MIKFVVIGTPQPAGSKTPGVTKDGRLYVRDANPKAAAWKHLVAREAKRVYDGPVLDDPIELTMVFYRERPKHHYGTGRNASVLKNGAPDFPTTTPDTVKQVRGTEDSLTGIVYRDDAQVVNVHAFKRYGSPARAEVEVRIVRSGLLPLGAEKNAGLQEELAQSDKLLPNGTLFDMEDSSC